MQIHSARFLQSTPDPKKTPPPDKPEYAFIGRSNVGKSSLINALVRQKSLAKTSQTPGKTQLINHFLINEKWYLVDLPGYGFAQVSKAEKAKFEGMIRTYLEKRENLLCTFVLIDIRHEPQRIDQEFMEYLGERGIPFQMVFTKADKLTPNQAKAKVEAYRAAMLETWEEVPDFFVTSAVAQQGRDELLAAIETMNRLFAPAKK
jgi:GTP-binding protein